DCQAYHRRPGRTACRPHASTRSLRVPTEQGLSTPGAPWCVSAPGLRLSRQGEITPTPSWLAPAYFWLWLIFREAKIRSSGMQHAQAEEIEVSLAVHLAFDQFEARNLPFHLGIALWPGQARSHRLIVAPQSCREAFEFARSLRFDARQPSIEW